VGLWAVLQRGRQYLADTLPINFVDSRVHRASGTASMPFSGNGNRQMSFSHLEPHTDTFRATFAVVSARPAAPVSGNCTL
jgi:hypothetical protein